METAKRYLDTFENLRRRKRWNTDTSILRFVALTLATQEQENLAERLETAAETLKRRAGWTGPLRSSIRYVVAAMILKRGLDPAGVHQAIGRVRDDFRRRRMKRGGLSEVIAALILVLKHGGGFPPAWMMDKLEAILAGWKKDHRWLTGVDDYPLAALHATREASAEEVALEVEQAYRALHELGYRRGNQMQLASHLLAIGPGAPRQLARRFHRLAGAFRQRGLRIPASRYDETAVLALCSGTPTRLAARVLEVRDRLRAAKPRPHSDIAFSLATGIVLSEDARERELDATGDVAAARMAQAVLEAQQAAMIAAMTATIAATSAATTAAGS
jgi:hypothetical protein